tara:strand:+ start:1251 stop:1631 length:381 start_codon:yes stop_codon:yes gene_type:complete
MNDNWVEPIFDEHGMTQWSWRVTNRENFLLGKNVEIGSFTIIDAMNSVTIGDNVKIGWNCTIMSNSTIDGKKGKIILKDGCGIGANSVIFPNVIIGKNATIGANSLVNCNVPDNEVWAGTPAKKIR